MHVGPDLGHVVAGGDYDLHVGREDASQKAGQVGDEPGECHGLQVEARAPREPKQLLHHHAPSKRCRHDITQVGVRVFERLRDRLPKQLGVGEDDGEQVVEVVRDPSRQLSNRFELLGLPQLLFERPPLRDIFRDRFEAVDRAVRAPHGASRQTHHDLTAVAPLPDDLYAVDRIAGSIEAGEDARALGRVGVDVGREVDPEELLFGFIAQHLHERRVDRQEPAGGRGPVDRMGGVLHQRAMTLLRAAQRVLGAAALCDVGAHANHSLHRPVPAAHRRVPAFEHHAEQLHGRGERLAGERAAHIRERVRQVRVQLERRAADKVRRAQPEGVEPAPLDHREHTLPVECEQHERRSRDDGAQPLLVGAQGTLLAPPLRDVPGVDDDMGGSTRRYARLPHRLEHPPRAVRRPEPELRRLRARGALDGAGERLRDRRDVIGMHVIERVALEQVAGLVAEHALH